MFYELKNGTLVETKDAQGNFDLTQVLGNKYLEDVDSEKCVIVDTYSNRCFLISKDLLHHGVSEEVYHKMLDSDETDSNKPVFNMDITKYCPDVWKLKRNADILWAMTKSAKNCTTNRIISAKSLDIKSG